MFHAGTAIVTYTPDEPLWLAGYAARGEPARSAASDLRASALALKDETGAILVLVSIDIIAVPRALADAVIADVQARHAIPRERFVFAASHTHYAPEIRPDKIVFFHIPPQYAAKIGPTFEHVRQAITQAALAAIADASDPVRLFARRTTANFAHNRRRAGVKGGTPSTDDVLDNDVPILDIVHARTGERKAIVFGYACHNTTIPPEDLRYCADWAGFAKTQLERDNPGATVLFVTGAGADQNPEPRGTLALAQQYGREIANAVQQAISSGGSTEITGPIRVAMDQVELALQPVTRDSLEQNLTSEDMPTRRKAKFLLDQIAAGRKLITSYPAPMQAMRFGDELLMIAMSGEPVVDWSHKFKREFASRARHVWVAGYCNDMYGYLPTRRVQLEGGYEGGRANLWSWVPAPWTDDVEDRVTDGIRLLVARL
jgi:neutral ceramidase